MESRVQLLVERGGKYKNHRNAIVRAIFPRARTYYFAAGHAQNLSWWLRLTEDTAQTMKLRKVLSHRRGFGSEHNHPLVRIFFPTKQVLGGKRKGRKLQSPNVPIPLHRFSLHPSDADVQYSG